MTEYLEQETIRDLETGDINETCDENELFVDQQIDKKRDSDASMEFEERMECRTKKRSQKGLEMDLDVARKKRNKAANSLKTRIKNIYESLRLPLDIAKLIAFKDAIEFDMGRTNKLQDDVTDLLIKVGDDSESDENQFKTGDSAIECLADVKTKLKDLEIERTTLLSRKSSSRSSRSTKSPTISSASRSSKRMIVDAVTLREEMKGLKKRQELDRRKENLDRQQREIERECEQ